MGDTEHGSRVGSRFGRYHLRRLLGRGGMGEVYEAEDTEKDRIVALKLITAAYSQDPVFRKRMRREARTAGRLQDPHVVPIHDYDEIDGQPYVEMRMIDGTDLAALLSRYGPLASARAVAIIRQIASALDNAHEAGVTHRDVKPANILITRDDFAYLVDFGIASAATEEKLTALGDFVGTYAYMAPERMTGDADEVTYKADIYALACVLHECLTGQAPYRGNAAGMMAAHLTQPPPRASDVRPGIPKAFDQVIARGMAKEPEQRYTTAGDLAMAAHNALTTPDQDQAEDILHRSQVATLPQNQPRPTQLPPTRQAQAPPSWSAPPAAPTRGPAWQTPAPFPAAQSPPPPVGGPPRGIGGAVTNTPSGGLRGPTPPTAPPSQPSQPWPPQQPVPVAPQWPAPQAEPASRKPKWWLILGAAALVVVLVVAGIVIWSQPPSPPPPPDWNAVRVADDGVLVGNPAAPTIVDIFDEPICPPCGTFVTSSANDIRRAIEAEKIAIRFHLLNFLNDKSASGDYSTRATAATLCVAEANDATLYQDFYFAIFAPSFQPLEDARADRTNFELVSLADRLGASAQVKTCIESGKMIGNADTMAADANQVLDRLSAEGTTPAVFEGKKSVNIDDSGWVDALG